MLSIWSLSANANSISLTRCFLVGLSSEALFSPDSMSSEKASIVSTSWKYIHASLGDSIETYSAQEKITVTDSWICMFCSFPPVQDGILTNKCLQCWWPWWKYICLVCGSHSGRFFSHHAFISCYGNYTHIIIFICIRCCRRPLLLIQTTSNHICRANSLNFGDISEPYIIEYLQKTWIFVTTLQNMDCTGFQLLHI